MKFKKELFDKMPIIGIARNLSKNEIEKIIPVYKRSGLTTLEITLNSENALEIIFQLREKHPDLNIGAGTVCSMEDLTNALKAGAMFIVTPVIDEEVISYCVKHEIPIFPGALTPSEIYKATKLGAIIIKLFPATQFGEQYIKDVLGPLNNIKLLPTGGVNEHNIETFFEAGSIGVGMGSTLFLKEKIKNNEFVALESHFKNIVEKVKPYIADF